MSIAWRRGCPFAVTLAAVATLCAGSAEAQASGSCALTAGAGVGLVGTELLFRERLADGRERGVEVGTGLSLALGFRCWPTSRLAAGLVLERERLRDLGLYRVLGALDGRLFGSVGARRPVVYVGLRAGWGGAEQIGDVVLLSVVPVGGGPALGTDLRLEWPAMGRLGVHVTGGWRASWVTREGLDDEAQLEDASTRAVHGFPLTAGLAIRF